MKRKKLWLFPAVLALALLCAACVTNAAAPQNEPSGEEDVAEFAAETADEVTQETSEADSQLLFTAPKSRAKCGSAFWGLH